MATTTAKAPALSREQLLKLYRDMVTQRAVDTRGFQLNRQGKIGIAMGSEGHEAVQAGTGLAFERGKDLLYPYYRNTGIILSCGFPLTDLFRSQLARAKDTTGGRSIIWPRGRVLGGSSSINGLIFIRGQHEDFDDWERLGAHGWSYQELLPYFRRYERYSGGESQFHGGLGEFEVSDLRTGNSASAAWIDAGVEFGLPRNPDFNGATTLGVGTYQLGIGRHWRSSSASAFLRPVMHRPNLTVVTRAQVSKVIFQKSWRRMDSKWSNIYRDRRPRNHPVGRRVAIAAAFATFRGRAGRSVAPSWH